MKFTWIEYAIGVWFVLLVIETIIELVYGEYNKWVLPAWLIIWCILLFTKTFVKKK